MTVVFPGSIGSGHGGTLQLTGNGLYNNIPMTINGGGVNGVSALAPGGIGALESLSGNNTWSGAITLGGAGSNGTDPTINQVSAQSGATLILSGAIGNAVGVNASLAKSGGGTVVLTGGSANTYPHLTRLYGGTLVVEKDSALGAAGSDVAADGNTYFLGNSSVVLAFRAPGASPGFSYTTNEWINTDGSGNGTLGQIDNLGGNNTFSGKVGLGGPTLGGIINSYLGVTAGSLTLSGAIYTRGASAIRNITKRGPGTLILSGDSSVGPTNVINNGTLNGTNSTFGIDAGEVQLAGTPGNTANIPGIATWTMQSGTNLRLGKQGAVGNAFLQFFGGKVTTALPMTVPGGIGVGTGGVTIDSLANEVTFAGAVTGNGGLTKQGAGTATLSGDVNGIQGGALTVSAGKLAVGAGGGAAGTMKISSLTIAGGAQLDLNDNDLVIDYSGPSPFTTAQQYVIDGLGGPSGIVSGVRDQSGAPTLLALIENTVGLTDWPVGSGVTIDATSIVGKYTYFGDVNLDGQVDDGDYGIIDSNFNATPTPGNAWLTGDANVDGIVNSSDYGIIDANYNLGVGNPLFPAALSAVPEPAGLLAMTAGGALLLRRRRAK